MVETIEVVRRMDGKDNVLVIQTYLVEAEVPFFCGKGTLEMKNSILDTKNTLLET